jgi:N-acylglucosamine-6-phosphate 2-epimerase
VVRLAALRGGLIVSCQAIVDSPLARPDVLGLIAASVVAAGAVAIRAEGIANLEAIRASVEEPLIGLWKDGAEGPYITPTLEHAIAVATAGADIVAIDATKRPRRDGRTLPEVINMIHQETRRQVLADVSTVDEGIAAADAGADLVATTLSGYTPYSPASNGPDLELVGELSSRIAIPVLAEGRVRTPQQARLALATGAWAVVVGAAITNPAAIASVFLQAIQARKSPAVETDLHLTVAPVDTSGDRA